MNREAWLQKALDICRKYMAGKGWKVPECHISVGWPSSRGLSAKSQRIGECWDAACSRDKKPHIFITPAIEDTQSDCGILTTVLHEAIHACVGCAEGHKGKFKECATALGFLPPMKSTPACLELLDMVKEWADGLGPYPHAKITNPEKDPSKKKQSTRMGKFECMECGYIARTTKKWLEQVGAPHCPNHGEMQQEVKGDKE